MSFINITSAALINMLIHLHQPLFTPAQQFLIISVTQAATVLISSWLAAVFSVGPCVCACVSVQELGCTSESPIAHLHSKGHPLFI